MSFRIVQRDTLLAQRMREHESDEEIEARYPYMSLMLKQSHKEITCDKCQDNIQDPLIWMEDKKTYCKRCRLGGMRAV